MKVNAHDNFNIISKSSLARVKNATRILSSYHLSRLSGKASIKGMPISVSFEPTTSCNLRCPECPSGLRAFTRPTGMLNQGLFQDVINQLASTLSYLTFYFQGEPFLHPQFLEMVNYASKKGIYTATSTNGHYLQEDTAKNTVTSSLDRLIISIDGTSQDSYQSYRIGGSLDKVIEGTKNITRWKKELKSRTPHVIFQFLVVKPNEHQIQEVYALAKELGVDQVALKTAQIYDYAQGSELIPTQDQYSRYRRTKQGTYEIKNKLRNECWKMWHSCVITWDGKVVPCCFDKDAHFVLGDLNKNSFKEIWSGEKYNEFRASLLHSRSEIEICKNCTEGTKVWA
ncbi:MAG: SPASM domain-containing protein [Cyclobacteriaceae bacterium]|nr:SPASM domain-containing protein [Cyclobacteriaceae bacterium]MDH4298350.1 SPASM domain-containing protein [Cyclobacteriaceae bacterium]MDH5247950.1 SPASM domain-containing protein [Cyclobacteriaceae bacterium]